MGQWLQLPLALLYKLLDVVPRAVLGQLTYVSFSFTSWPSLQHPGGTLALRKHCLLFPFGFSSKGALFLEVLNLNHSCKGSGPRHHKFPCKGHHPHRKGQFYMCRKLCPKLPLFLVSFPSLVSSYLRDCGPTPTEP